MNSYTHEKQMVMPLLVAALFANFLLFAVSYSGASFSGYERSLPTLGFSQITAPFDQAIATATDNFTWAVSTVATMVKPGVLAFLGMQDYQFGQQRFTSLPPNHQVASSRSAGTSQVLGIYIVNSAYSSNTP